MGLTRITSDGITDGSIVNADINGSAAIAGSKLNTNFGSSGMTATGSCSFGNITISNVAPKIFLTDSDTDSDFSIRNMHGVFGIHDQTNSADRLTITSDGHIRIPADDKKLQIGASQDLQIYHDGTDSNIENTNGTLKISSTAGNNLRLRSDNLRLQSITSTEDYLRATKDGGVQLYYDNSNMLETINGGARVNGVLHVTSHLDMNDNDIIKLGDDDDLQIYHDGTNSIIANTTGPLIIRDQSATRIHTDFFVVNNFANDENLILGYANGAVELYYNNGKKFETTSGGARITGILSSSITSGQAITLADGAEIHLGTGDDLKIYHDGTSSILKNTTGALYVQSDDTRIVNAANSETIARFIADGAVELYHNAGKKLETTSSGIDVTGGVNADGLSTFSASGSAVRLNDGSIQRYGNADADYFQFYDGSNDIAYLSVGTSRTLRITTDDFRVFGANNTEQIMRGQKDGAVELYYDNSKKFETKNGGAVLFGDLELLDSNKLLLGDANDLQLYHDGSNSFIKDAGTGSLVIQASTLAVNNAAGTEQMMKAVENGAVELNYDGSKKLETTSNGVKILDRFQFVGGVIFDNTANGNNCGISFNGDGIRATDGAGTEIDNARDLGQTSYRWRNVYAVTYYGDGSNLTGIASFASGTVMLFQQTNAPTGWTKLTSHNNKALRLVSGTPGTGGSNTFTTAFNSSRSTSGGSVSNHTLSVSQIPSHNHTFSINNEYNQLFYPNQGIVARGENKSGIDTYSTSSTGSGSSHNHGFSNPSLNLNVQYVDVIMASKD